MNNCEVCGSTQLMSFQAKERMFGLNDTFEYLECNSCKGLFLKSIPEDLGKYYPANYYSFGEYVKSNPLSQALKKLRYDAFKLGISLRSPNYFDWLSQLKANKQSKIADIGCGNGQLLAELSYCGFNSLHGYDPFLAKTTNSEGFSLRKVDFFEIEEKYDLVMFHHSFEHIPHPNELFKKLVQILNPGGEALIRVPVTDGKVWLEEREFWFQLDAPRHLFIPHTKSMKVLAERFELDLFNISFDSLDSQFWGTELYKRGKPYMGARVEEEFSKDDLINFKEMATQYNANRIGDQACFYFRKDA
ncbi:class I SAM-dependent methyltransferase [Algoriphagus sp. D3-2-R+10]|uniref:class I SAM-dependent methyltransferase n=1 Tax=Algoriphagus aurantiacus TaxID=3103948 RepID=UPI002B3A2F40|nr:class I SAM-dependent methyltransferase [Algoriphagus sp. D3-2-R+10]MEB2776532.1 class I SAM-dependent methyltransferase [Algoriphagus sp. D3-2-R+10]